MSKGKDKVKPVLSRREALKLLGLGAGAFVLGDVVGAKTARATTVLTDKTVLSKYTTMPYDILVGLDSQGRAYAVDKKGNLVAGPSTDHAYVIQEAINNLTNGGKIYLNGDFTFNNKVTIPSDLNLVIIEGLGVNSSHTSGGLEGTVINVNTDIGFEYTANGDWTKRLVFRNLGFNGIYTSPPYAIRYYDAFRTTFENISVYNADIRIENVDYWTEGNIFRDVHIINGGIKFAKTGTSATSSLADTVLDNVMVTPRDNDVGLLLDGTSLYRAKLFLFLGLGGTSQIGIKTINGGSLTHSYGFIKTDTIASGNAIIDFESGINSGNNIMIYAPNINESYFNIGNWADGIRLGGLYQYNDWFRNSISPTIGLSNTYGSYTTVYILPKRFPKNVHISVTGVATGETITVKFEAYYNPDQTRYIEKSFTADGTQDLTDWDIAYLSPLGNNVTPISLRVYAKSDQTSTSASVTVYVTI